MSDDPEYILTPEGPAQGYTGPCPPKATAGSRLYGSRRHLCHILYQVHGRKTSRMGIDRTQAGAQSCPCSLHGYIIRTQQVHDR